MAGALLHKVPLPGDDPRLRPTEQLVAREHDERCAGGEGLTGGRFAVQPGERRRAALRIGKPGSGCVEQPGADVRHDGHAEVRQRLNVGLLREAGDPVVGLMNLEDQRDVERRVGHGVGVVASARPVRRPDLDQRCPRVLEHLGDAEAATDLHELAAAHDDSAPTGQCGEDQHHRGRTVVDDERCLGPGEAGDQRVGVDPPRASTTCLEIELQVRRADGCGAGPGPQRGAAEVGVQQYPRRVHYRAEQTPAVVGHIADGMRCRIAAVGRDRVAGGIDEHGAGNIGERRIGAQYPSQGINGRRALHAAHAIRPIRAAHFDP